MNNVVTSEQGRLLQEERISSRLQARAGKGIVTMLLILLVLPTINMIPTRTIGGLNRPITVLVNFISVAIWLLIRISYGRFVSLRPKWFDAALLLLPATFILSDLVFAINGGSLGSNHIYEILNSLRPITFVQVSMFILRLGKVTLDKFGNLMQKLVNVISFVVIYIGLLAAFQMMGVTFVQNFLHFFYRFEGENLHLVQIAYDAIQNYGRATSIFHWANSLGEFLSIALFILFVYFLDRPSSRGRYLIAIAIGMFGIALSGSRSSLIALVIGILVILIVRRQFKLFIIALVGGLIILFAMEFVTHSTGNSSRYVEFFNYIFEKGPMPQTLQHRIGTMSSITSGFAKADISHWTGTTVVNWENIAPLNFDSEYLKYLVWSGYFGLAAFILFQAGVIFYLWSAFRYFPRHTPGNILSLALLAACLSMSVTAFSQDSWSGERSLQLVFILLGVLVYMRNLSVKNRAKRRSK
jgi:hypothetical protein